MNRMSRGASYHLNFRHWSRRSYALFNSVGKVVRMGVQRLLLLLPGGIGFYAANGVTSLS